MKRLRANPGLCRSCQACALACTLVNENGRSSLSEARIRVEKPVADLRPVLVVCRHCARPACAAACPTGAMDRGTDGLVRVREDLCTDCGDCARACPFGAVVPIPRREARQKCDLCEGRPEGPACVEVCPVGAVLLS